jgi:hypothetical protein
MTTTKISPKRGDARNRFVEYRRRITGIADYLGRGRVQVSDDDMGTFIDVTRSQVRVTRQLMVSMGVLAWEHKGDLRAPFWQMLKFGQDLQHQIHLEMERQMRGGLSPESLRKKAGPKRSRKLTPQSQERVAVTEDRLGFQVAAVSGPERPEALRSSLAGAGPNAPAALVMAAKQYRTGRGGEDVVRAKKLLRELEEIGVAVPEELRKRATVQKDERLEAIGLVLPYIEELERRLVGAQDQLREQKDYGTLRQRVESQKHQIERLVAERTADALGQTPHRS